MSNEQKVYLTAGEKTVFISSFPLDHPDAEKYTIEVQEILSSGRVSDGSIQLNIIRNILSMGGCKTVVE